MDKKKNFEQSFKKNIASLNASISSSDQQWTVKGFIDLFENIYTISSDTKVVSKILEIHLFPFILDFARKQGYNIVLAQHQNYYPDFSFIDNKNTAIKFAVDMKTTYRLPMNRDFCNGFTLGSHGEYFENRKSTKNIQFPYDTYSGHYCLGIIYDRCDIESADQNLIYSVKDLKSIPSVIGNFDFFFTEKWKIASDKSGSGNTANIGSIHYIPDILSENGMFSLLGEEWFDDYWMNYNKITISSNGKTKKITSIYDFVKYRNGNESSIVKHKSTTKKKSNNE